MKYGFTILSSAVIVLFFGFRNQEKSFEKEGITDNIKAYRNASISLENNQSMVIKKEEFHLGSLTFVIPKVPIIIKSFGDQPSPGCIGKYGSYTARNGNASYLQSHIEQTRGGIDDNNLWSHNGCTKIKHSFFQRVIQSDVARDLLFDYYVTYYSSKLDSIPKTIKEHWKVEIRSMIQFLNEYPSKKHLYKEALANSKKYRDYRKRFNGARERYDEEERRGTRHGTSWYDASLNIGKRLSFEEVGGRNNAWMLRRIEWDSFPIDAMKQYLKKGIEILDANESKFDCVYNYYLNNEIYIYNDVNATIFERDGKKLKVGMAPKVTCIKDGALNYYLIKTKDKEMLVDSKLNIINR